MCTYNILSKKYFKDVSRESSTNFRSIHSSLQAALLVHVIYYIGEFLLGGYYPAKLTGFIKYIEQVRRSNLTRYMSYAPLFFLRFLALGL